MNFDEEQTVRLTNDGPITVSSRNERAAKERQFTIGGEHFAYRPGVEPEVLADWMDVGDGTPEAEAIRVADATIIAFLDPGDVDRWRALRQPGALSNPITSGDLLAVLRWLIGQQGSRPTEPSRASSTGSPTLESVPALTDESSSAAVRG
jgi:hypothetical protein